MINKKHTLFIKKLTELTIRNELQWEYLENNEDLFVSLDLTDEEFYAGSLIAVSRFVTERSFYIYLADKNMYVLALTNPNNSSEVIIAPNTFKNILHLTDKDYPVELTELFNEIRHHFPNPDDFIEDFLGNDL